MKKKLYSFAMIMVMMLVSLIMTACGDPKPTKIEIDKNSVETTIEIGSEHILNNLKIIVTYDNGDTEEHTKNDKMEITEINPNVLGKQDLKVKYLGLEAKLEINVEEPGPEVSTEDIVGYAKPKAYVDGFEYNNSEAGKDIYNANNDKKFAKKSNYYKVGDDNPFVFLPRVEAMDDEGDTREIKRYLSDVTVKQNGVVLTGDDLTDMVEIDNVNSTFDFTQEAADENAVFEITVKPDGMPSDATYDPITITVQVVDGWNAYTTADLSRMDNCAKTQTIWADLKTKNKISNDKINGIVLHSDMVLTKQDIPSLYIYGAGEKYNNNDGKGEIDVAGSLIDSTSLYTIDVDPTDTFSIYGNFYTIRTENEGPNAFPLVKAFSHDGQFGHAALIAVGGDNKYWPADANNQGNFYMENLSLKGNGSQAETSDENKGGLIGILTSAKDTTIENCLLRAFGTHIIALGTSSDYPTLPAFETECSVKNTKMIDSYSSMFMAWGSQENTIQNSVMKQSGGPLVIATHVWHDENSGAYYNDMYANVKVEDSILDAPVLGNEAWFASSGAGEVIGTFNAFDMLFKNFSSEFTGDDKDGKEIKSGFVGSHGEYNFQVVTMGADSIFNTRPIASETEVTVDGEVKAQQAMGDPFVAAFKTALLATEQVEDGINTFPPMFKAGNVFITLDIAKGSAADQGLALLITDPTILAAAASQNPFNDAGFLPLSLDENLTSNPVYLGYKTQIDAMLTEFFTAEHVSVFLNGQILGCTFQMHHLEV